jgi:hypothetical protein
MRPQSPKLSLPLNYLKYNSECILAFHICAAYLAHFIYLDCVALTIGSNRGSHSAGYEELYLLGYNAVQSVESQPTIWLYIPEDITLH